MSDTPRTDEIWLLPSKNILAHARQLERELNEALSTIESLREELTRAREEAEGFADLLNHKIKQMREP